MKFKMPQVGDTAQESLLITDEDVRAFAELSGDNNPIHLDDEYAARTRFKRRIAHGVFTAGLLSKVMGTKLPGPGTIYLGQTTKFKNPTYIGDTITAIVKVLNARNDKPVLVMQTICQNQDGEILLEGEATVLYEPVQ
jgi:3-hydroxybutyryl-CoA dehydratase